MKDNHQNPPGSERRRNPRHKGVIVEYALVKVIKDNKEIELKSALIRDISVGGVSIFVDEHIEAGERLILKLYSAGVEIPIIAIGTVVWSIRSMELPHKNKFHFNLGIEFTQIDKKNQAQLERMIRIFEVLEHNPNDNVREI